MITKDARRTREIKSIITIAKAAFNRKKHFFCQQIGLKFVEETVEVLHLSHSQKWC
jgi:hypothetical protein